MLVELATAYINKSNTGKSDTTASRRTFLKAIGSALLAAAIGSHAARSASFQPKKGSVMRVHAIETGGVKIKTTQIEGRGHGLARQAGVFVDQSWSDWLPTYCWAIEHSEGVIVVDTGQAAHLKSLPVWHPYFQLCVQFRIEPEEEVGPQLRALGIGTRDVRQVILTHVHSDHDAGLAHFPHAKIQASAGEIARASGLAGQLRGYLPQRWPSWFDPAPIVFEQAAFGPFDQSRRLTQAGDVIALPTPGHTPDHLSVAVLDGDTILFLAGDTSYAEHQMKAGIIDGVSPDEGVALASLGKIRQLAKQSPLIYLPTHDGESAQRLASRKIVSFGKSI